MRRWWIIGVIALVVIAGLGFVFGYDGYERHDATRVVTTANGETVIIDRDGPRFFPFGFFFFPLFWFLVLAAIFTFVRRGRWGGPPPPSPSAEGHVPPWFDEWHRRVHEAPVIGPVPPEKGEQQS